MDKYQEKGLENVDGESGKTRKKVWEKNSVLKNLTDTLFVWADSIVKCLILYTVML